MIVRIGHGKVMISEESLFVFESRGSIVFVGVKIVHRQAEED